MFFISEALIDSKKYNLHREVNGVGGLEYDLHNSVDLVLVDIGLPGLNEFDVAQNISIQKPQVPIVALSTNSLSDYTLIGSGVVRVTNLVQDAGIDAYLVKPYLCVLLVDIIDSYMTKKN